MLRSLAPVMCFLLPSSGSSVCVVWKAQALSLGVLYVTLSLLPGQCHGVQIVLCYMPWELPPGLSSLGFPSFSPISFHI